MLLIAVMIVAIILIGQRYKARTNYTILANLNNEAETLNKEYTRLQIEEGTFSSNLVLKEFAMKKLGLTEADKNHLINLRIK